ncbi:MAG: phosphoribosylformylglycinamidine synthase, purS protein [Candidatus Taylorbacteria bacterium RIFCSPHIGHO2_02_FULL_46_13]|uniref:Phosphoribosylformylglycinamidine synthase subunit PurS n=1 Tax=Candidatus Taylorbacteria bacterium RIFCSPHIGHO2_02_FULL_46_13 TaxID=1802312 RepID=A0A1G2MUA9_9BACT|nr:MAG: phosphoribosylformylglycinamidine synthase, purS protein [Candidatus Taylorbacteria bacterium RIFCSPHIGHO2_02_FULL_46_13]
MGLKFYVTPQKQVVHPASEVVKRALHQMGHSEVQVLTLGKYFEVEIAEGALPHTDQAKLKEFALKAGLYNPVIEDCRAEVES